MEEKKLSSHKVTLENRKSGTVSGVVDVVSFDEKIILLATQCGKVTIKGEDLHVHQLSLQKGEIEIEGRIDSLVYTEHGKGENGRKESMLKRMFQ